MILTLTRRTCAWRFTPWSFTSRVVRPAPTARASASRWSAISSRDHPLPLASDGIRQRHRLPPGSRIRALTVASSNSRGGAALDAGSGLSLECRNRRLPLLVLADRVADIVARVAEAAVLGTALDPVFHRVGRGIGTSLDLTISVGGRSRMPPPADRRETTSAMPVSRRASFEAQPADPLDLA